MLLADGSWVPGVRFESASFSLTVPAVVAAHATARTAGRDDVVAAALTRPFRDEERIYLRDALGEVPAPASESGDVLVWDCDAPVPGDRLSPFLGRPAPGTPAAGVAAARAVAAHAHAPLSHYPVGCILVTADGLLVPGANIEHPDWSRILCAERVALVAARAYGAGPCVAGYLSCLRDPQGSPCGACRQLLFEHDDGMDLWMDRGPRAPEQARPADLLPGAFGGAALRTVPEA